MLPSLCTIQTRDITISNIFRSAKWKFVHTENHIKYLFMYCNVTQRKYVQIQVNIINWKYGSKKKSNRTNDLSLFERGFRSVLVENRNITSAFALSWRWLNNAIAFSVLWKKNTLQRKISYVNLQYIFACFRYSGQLHKFKICCIEHRTFYIGCHACDSKKLKHLWNVKMKIVSLCSSIFLLKLIDFVSSVIRFRHVSIIYKIHIIYGKIATTCHHQSIHLKLCFSKFYDSTEKVRKKKKKNSNWICNNQRKQSLLSR